MKNAKLPQRRSANMSKPKLENQAAVSQTPVEKNREQEARFEILQAFNRLAVPHSQWPEFVQEFYTTAGQRTEYHHFIAPTPFRAPRFDRLKQSPREWAIVADTAWARHRDDFLRRCEGWVALGVDQRIDEKRVRGPGKRVSAAARDRVRGGNSTIGQRYEWTAKYLVGVPLKEIAGANDDVSTVGRVARAVLRSAGWSMKSRKDRRGAQNARTYEEFPKAKYHPSEPARIVNDCQEEAALGPGWSDAPSAKDVK